MGKFGEGLDHFDHRLPADHGARDCDRQSAALRLKMLPSSSVLNFAATGSTMCSANSSIAVCISCISILNSFTLFGSASISFRLSAVLFPPAILKVEGT